MTETPYQSLKSRGFKVLDLIEGRWKFYVADLKEGKVRVGVLGSSGETSFVVRKDALLKLLGELGSE